MIIDAKLRAEIDAHVAELRRQMGPLQDRHIAAIKRILGPEIEKLQREREELAGAGTGRPKSRRPRSAPVTEMDPAVRARVDALRAELDAQIAELRREMPALEDRHIVTIKRLLGPAVEQTRRLRELREQGQ